MSSFKVKISGMNSYITEAESEHKILMRLESEIRSIRSGLDSAYSGGNSVKSNLNVLADRVEDYGAYINGMKFAASVIKRNYVNTENKLCGKKGKHSVSAVDFIDSAVSVGVGLAMSAIFPGSTLFWVHKNFPEWFDGDKANGEVSGKGKFTGIKYTQRDMSIKRVYDKNGNPIKEEWEDKDENDVIKTFKDKYLKKNDDGTYSIKKNEVADSITIYTKEAKAEYSLLGDKGTLLEGEAGYLNGNYDVLKAEAHATGTVSAAGVKGEVGASFTAFTAGVDGFVGKKDVTVGGYNLGGFGLYGKGEVNVGKVDANAGLNLGFVGEDGSVSLKNFNAQASASAEAILAEATGSAGVELFGTDVGVKGGVNFGVGARASAGYSDGKFTLGAGVSLGVGVSLDLEIDVSGTIDAVCDNVEKIESAVTDIANDAWNTVSDGWGMVKSGWNSLWK